MNLQKLKGLYARLKGIESAITDKYASKIAGHDYDFIVNEVKEVLQDDNFIAESYLIPGDEYNVWTGDLLKANVLLSKIRQLIFYIEYTYNLNEKILEIGSLYNAIQDEELKARASDLLTAVSHFDRAVNQATLVLEDRIRTKAECGSSLIGESLVNKAINSDKNKTILIISDDENEHKGFADIYRGIVGALRNQTHHYLKNISREEALKICGFIDHLLKVIDKAKVK